MLKNPVSELHIKNIKKDFLNCLPIACFALSQHMKDLWLGPKAQKYQLIMMISYVFISGL